jgi:dTDP-4-dehydrorhamnose reductase
MSSPGTWLVTGAAGMLGTDVRAVLDSHGIRHDDVTRVDLDLLDEKAVDRAVAGHDVVVNCAAWTAVDDAEEHEAEAFLTNAVAPGLLARAAQSRGARLLQVSTDYVFDGHATSPYGEHDALAPRSAYGRTKGAGEWAVLATAPAHAFVLRTAWLYGAHGGCFPRTIARAARERGALQVVEDQVGQPTWTRDVAELMVTLVRTEAAPGVWHATSSGEASWFEFARAVVETAGLSPEIVSPTDSTAFQRPAPRPAYSVLGHQRLLDSGVAPIGDWHERWRVAGPSVLAVDQLD